MFSRAREVSVPGSLLSNPSLEGKAIAPMTNTPANSNDRLDRIEVNLEVVTESLVTLAAQANTTDQRLAQFEERFNRFIAQAEADRAFFRNQMATFREQAEADRATMQQILQFLQNQYPGNGNAGRQ
jgi:hypothetical protein